MVQGLSKRFIKSQINSAVSTLLDFLVTIFLKEFVGLWYLLSSASGTFMGGCCNYLVGRHWVFKAVGPQQYRQVLRYLIFWSINFFLNVLAVYVLTDLVGLKYLFSKILVAIIFGVFVNYFLQKRIVYNVQIT